MATTTREGGAGGGGGGGGRERDNRRLSTSSSNPFSKKPASSTTNKPSDKKPIHSSTSFNKPVPNYLKPTFSSRLNPSSTTTTTTRTTPRRPTAAAPTKPSFDRTRSFDIRDIKTSHATSSASSSTSSKASIKPTGPQRSFSMLPSRSAKPAAAAPPIRRSLSTRVPPIAGLKKHVKKSGAKSVTSESCIDIEARDQDPLDNMIGSQDDQDEVLSLPEISEMPGQEEQLGDPVMIEETHLVQNDEKIVEEASNEKVDDEQNGENSVEESGEGVVEEEEESANVEEKHVVVELEEEKEEDEQVVKKDESPAKEDTSITQSGKQKEAQDYNEVIEETASKLMENKRNKVRALAGAFETVISLQEPKCERL